MNSLYNKLMAEKGAPRAANSPNQTQLRGAPMNLRSAMQKYAEGGGVGSPPPSAGDINSFVQANMGNPQAIADAARQYGVSMDDLAGATGYSSSQINDYFGNAGLNPFGYQSPPQVQGYTTPEPPEPIRPQRPEMTTMPPMPPRPDRPEPPPRPSIESVPPSYMIPRSEGGDEGYNEPEIDYGSFEPEYRGRLDSQNPTMFSPDPNPSQIQGRTKDLDPVKRFNFNNPEVSSELLRKIQESMANPFGSQITSQDELMKLLQALKAQS
jgi:hypothetical protein